MQRHPMWIVKLGLLNVPILQPWRATAKDAYDFAGTPIQAKLNLQQAMMACISDKQPVAGSS